MFGFSLALSALKAFGKRMEVIANNVANINTDGFKSKRATLEEKPGGGVAVRIDLGTETEPPGTYEKNGRLTQPLPSETDLAQEIPLSLITQRGYEANLKSIETEDEMLDTLVHIIE